MIVNSKNVTFMMLLVNDLEDENDWPRLECDSPIEVIKYLEDNRSKLLSFDVVCVDTVCEDGTINDGVEFIPESGQLLDVLIALYLQAFKVSGSTVMEGNLGLRFNIKVDNRSIWKNFDLDLFDWDIDELVSDINEFTESLEKSLAGKKYEIFFSAGLDNDFDMIKMKSSQKRLYSANTVKRFSYGDLAWAMPEVLYTKEKDVKQRLIGISLGKEDIFHIRDERYDKFSNMLLEEDVETCVKFTETRHVCEYFVALIDDDYINQKTFEKEIIPFSEFVDKIILVYYTSERLPVELVKSAGDCLEVDIEDINTPEKIKEYLSKATKTSLPKEMRKTPIDWTVFS